MEGMMYFSRNPSGAEWPFELNTLLVKTAIKSNCGMIKIFVNVQGVPLLIRGNPQ
jgi:hypothetical protein